MSEAARQPGPAHRLPTSARLFCALGIPAVQCGDDLAALLVDGVREAGDRLQDGDIVVIAQKIVSKAEGRRVSLSDVEPSAEALRLAGETGKDARLVELILCESIAIVRSRPGLIIARHRLGLVLANAGIDQSNLDPQADCDPVLLLPEDPSRSCRQLRQSIARLAGVDVAVVINDSIGRPWRLGTVGIAIGSDGLSALLDLRGSPDLYGRPMETAMSAIGDQVASMASLLQGECDEGRPIVVCRGFGALFGEGSADKLLRPSAEDLFR